MLRRSRPYLPVRGILVGEAGGSVGDRSIHGGIMRKSRFLINLIAATAIGLSVVGCGESSSTGAIRDTSDISNPGGGTTRDLREYLVIAQRGLEVPASDFAAGQTLPTEVPPQTEAGMTPKDEVGIVGGLMYELLGISSVPTPDLQFVTPGSLDGQDPVGTQAPPNEGDVPTGYHQVYASPSGQYVIGVGRAKNNVAIDDATARVQVYKVNVPPTDVVFPPQPTFGVPAAPVSLFDFASNQGEFVSGAWSRDGNYFYVSISGFIQKATFTESNGRLVFAPIATVPIFPVGGAGVNNAVELKLSRDGRTLYALDNANGDIVTYSVDTATGDLTETNITATVADPRGFALDRTGTFLYVAGRNSGELAGYRVEADGSLTPIELFAGAGAVPFNYGVALGDVAANPITNQLFLGSYDGVVSGFTINMDNGSLVDGGAAAAPLNGARNLANLEVEPTGRFLLTAFEHDLDSTQNFVFANTNSATNGIGGSATSLTPSTDKNGRIAYLFPTTEGRAFEGEIQSARIDARANVSVEHSVDVDNPYGLAFLQLTFSAPAGTEFPVP